MLRRKTLIVLISILAAFILIGANQDDWSGTIPLRFATDGIPIYGLDSDSNRIIESYCRTLGDARNICKLLYEGSSWYKSADAFDMAFDLIEVEPVCWNSSFGLFIESPNGGQVLEPISTEYSGDSLNERINYSDKSWKEKSLARNESYRYKISDSNGDEWLFSLNVSVSLRVVRNEDTTTKMPIVGTEKDTVTITHVIRVGRVECLFGDQYLNSNAAVKAWVFDKDCDGDFDSNDVCTVSDFGSGLAFDEIITPTVSGLFQSIKRLLAPKYVLTLIQPAPPDNVHMLKITRY